MFMATIRNVINEMKSKQSSLTVLANKPIFSAKVLLKYISKNIFSDNSLWGISFASSYDCNFFCSHCYAKRFRENCEKRVLTLEEKKHVIKECLELGVISFDFVGGEIGLSKELEELIIACEPRRSFISLASNGYIMNCEKVKYFKKLGVDKISISIDSSCEELHDNFRNMKGSYRKCFEAIENIRKEGIGVVIITCVSKGMTRDKSFYGLVEYSISNKVPLIFSAAIPTGNWEGNIDLLCDAQDLQTMKGLHDKHHFLTRDCYENMGSYGCPAAKQIIYISEYGDVMPCAFCHVTFGNVLYESIRDIRKRMLKIPEFNQYYPGCIASENREFIDKFIRKSVNSKTYPIISEEIFPGDSKEKASVYFSRDIKKVSRPCPFCGSERRITISSGRESEFENTTQDLFFIVKCSDCSLVYLNPRPDESELGKIYPKQYYCYNASFNSSGADVSLLAPIKQILNDWIGFPMRIKKLIKSFSNNTSSAIKVLDIGCGNGDALDVFKRYGGNKVETMGLDFNHQALELIIKRGHKAIEGRIEQAKLPKSTFDIIYSSNVIEHVAEPAVMIEKVAESLKSGGVFLCETPNFNSLDARLFSSSGYWGGYHFPRHWTFFTAKTFTRIAEKVGLSVESISYHPVPIFWIWTMHAYLYRGKGRKDIAELFFPLIENQRNIFISFLNKIIFTMVDLLISITTRRTSLMSICLRKK